MTWGEKGLGFVVYDVETERFSRPFPDVDIPDWCWIYPQAATLADGRVLLAGGDHCAGSITQRYAAVLDPATGITSPLPLLGEARIHPAMALLPDGRVLVPFSEGLAEVDAEAKAVVIAQKELAAIIRAAPTGFGEDDKKFRYDVIFLKEPLSPKEAMKSVAVREGGQGVRVELRCQGRVCPLTHGVPRPRDRTHQRAAGGRSAASADARSPAR